MKSFLFVLNNYVWVPVVSAVIGGVLSLIFPVLWKKWKQRKKVN